MSGGVLYLVLVQWCKDMSFKGPVILSFFFFLCPRMAASTLTVVCIPDRNYQIGVSKKLPGGFHLLPIGHKCVTCMPLVARAFRKVSLYLSSS